MDQMTQLMLILCGLVGLGVFGFIFAIAGKDILYVLMRLIFKHGSDIYILNYNKQLRHYYKIPKQDGTVRIKGILYVVNPEKILSLSEADRIIIDDFKKKRRMKLEQKLQFFKEKKLIIEQELEKVKKITNQNTEGLVSQLENQRELFILRIKELNNKLEGKIENFYHRGRSALLYVENDPIPKDLYDYYTELDSVMLDNILARVMTKDPKAVKDLEKFLNFLKIALLIIGACAVAGLLISIWNQTALTELTQKMGVTIKV